MVVVFLNTSTFVFYFIAYCYNFILCNYELVVVLVLVVKSFTCGIKQLFRVIATMDASVYFKPTVSTDILTNCDNLAQTQFL